MFAILVAMAMPAQPVLTPVRLPPTAAAQTLKLFNRDQEPVGWQFVKAPSVKCREKTIRADCNICRQQICTDGQTQWKSGGMECTMAYCGDIQDPYNPKDWLPEGSEGSEGQR